MATKQVTQKTTDHDEIRRWVEERAGRPALIEADGNGGGVLRIDFGEPDDSLEQISWDHFFKIFDESELAFLYQEEMSDGRRSYFNKFVARGAEPADNDEPEGLELDEG